MTQTEIKEAISEMVPDKEETGNAIFVMNYKIGPVLKTKNFQSKNLETAQVDAQRFIEHLKSRDNIKVMLIGKVEPFCRSIDEEIEIYNRKNPSTNLALV